MNPTVILRLLVCTGGLLQHNQFIRLVIVWVCARTPINTVHMDLGNAARYREFLLPNRNSWMVKSSDFLPKIYGDQYTIGWLQKAT